MIKKIILYILLIVSFTLSVKSFGQVSSQIKKIYLDKSEKKVVIDFLAIDNQHNLLSLDSSNIDSLSEFKDGKYYNRIETGFNLRKLSINISKTPTKYLFILDISISMAKELDQAKKTIRSILLKYPFVRENAYITKLGSQENYPDEKIPMGDSALDKLLDTYQATDLKTLIYKGLKIKISSNSDFQGIKYIFLLTDGINDENNQGYPVIEDRGVFYYESKVPINKNDSNLRIFSIAYSGYKDQKHDPHFLKYLCNTTLSKEDYFDFAPTEVKINSAINSAVSKTLPANYSLSFFPAKACYFSHSEARNYVIQFSSNGIKYTINKSEILTPVGVSIDICSNKNESFYFQLLLGFLIICLFYIWFVYILPLIRLARFKNKYVMTLGSYRKTNILYEDFSVTDGYTQRELLDNELVVNKCKKVQSYESWIANGNHSCINLQTCQFKCPQGLGLGVPKLGNFFTMKGQNKQYNWLFFGLVAGFLIFTLINLPFIGFENWVIFKKFIQIFIVDESADRLSKQLYLSLAWTVCLISLLSIVEDIGQRGKILWIRLLLRLLIGILIFPVVFLVPEVIFIDKLKFNNELGLILSWLFIGACTGLLLSIKSSVITKYGLLGGILAAITASLVRIIIQHGFKFQSETSDLLIFMCFGAVLGYFIYKVMDLFEDYYLEVIRPTEFAGHEYRIMNWLQNGENVKIGRGDSNKCDVRLKWNDESVRTHHASISKSGDNLYLHPFENAEVKINEIRLDGKSKILKINDRIILGNANKSELILKGTKKEKNSKQGKSTQNPKRGILEIIED